MSTQPTPNLLDDMRVMAQRLRLHGMSRESARFSFDREYVIATLIEHQGNVCRTAKALSVHRNTLGREFHRLSIDARLIRGMCKKAKAKLQ